MAAIRFPAARQLRILMRICTILFVGTGLIFLLGGEEVLRAINWLAVKVRLAEVDPEGGRFWQALALSMMAVISYCSWEVGSDPGRNCRLMPPVILAKATSAFLGLAFFLFAEKALAYLVIFIVDGILMLILWSFFHFFTQEQYSRGNWSDEWRN